MASLREKTTEVEKEIERQRLLEIERARTRELRYNLDLEKEKQAQARKFFTTAQAYHMSFYSSRQLSINEDQLI